MATFAAAQEGILSRHRQHEETSSIESLRPLRSSSFTRDAVLSFWSRLQAERPNFRVGQVDAELLDEELLELLRSQVGDALKYYGSHFRDDWSDEIQLGLRTILFKLSIWDNNASYGASLQNLKYRNSNGGDPSRWQKGLYGLFTVLGRYVWGKWETWLADQEGYPSTGKLSQITSWVSTTHSTAAFASFIVFLVNGRYRTLTDRLLRLRLASPAGQISREVSFEYLNRQLVWHAFTEFLLFLLPLVGIGRWKRWLSRVWNKTRSALNSEKEEVKTGSLTYLPELTCAICYQEQNATLMSDAEVLGAGSGGVIGSATTDVVNPYQTPCKCIYCFICIAKKIEEEEGGGWICLRCGEIVYSCRPGKGDVIEKGQREKTVAFDVEESKDIEHLATVDEYANQWTKVEDSEASANATHSNRLP